MIERRYIDLKHELFDIYYGKLNDMQRERRIFGKRSESYSCRSGKRKTTVLVNRITHIIRYGNGYAVNFIPGDLNEETIDEMERAKSLPHDEARQISPKDSHTMRRVRGR